MKKIIFGSTCMICGMLLVIIMLFMGAYPNAGGSLNALGKLFIGAGAVTSVAGFFFCIFNLSDKNEDKTE